MSVRRLKSWLLVLIFMFVILSTVVFMLENQQSVIITFLGWPSAAISVSTCIVIALLLGMVVGPFGFWLIARWRSVTRRT